MVKQIVRDVFFLGQPSEPATKADIQVGKDLQDTLQANRERCVGMAANMIGVKKNIIIVNMGFINVVMFNPVIVSKRDMYETEEGCLSLDGVRKTTRWAESRRYSLDLKPDSDNANVGKYMSEMIGFCVRAPCFLCELGAPLFTDADRRRMIQILYRPVFFVS